MSLLSPRLVPLHLAGIVSVLLAVWAGWWQVGVWHDHRTDKSAELAHATPVPIDDLIGPDDPFPKKGVGEPVTVSGSWQTGDETTVEHGDKTWFVMPLRAKNGSAVLVVRGAAPTGGAIAAVPPVGQATIAGWLEPSDDIVKTIDWLGKVDYDLYSAYVIQRDASPGLETVQPGSLPKADAFTSLRNLLYGVEWWIFAAFAIFLWFRWARDLANPRITHV